MKSFINFTTSWWSNQKLATKIGSIILITSIFFSLGIGIYHVTLNKTILAFKQLQSTHQAREWHAMNIHRFSLEARRSEKDFLMRNELQYAQLVTKQVNRILKETKALAELEQQLPQATTNATQMSALITSYHTNFQQIVIKWQRKGLDHHSGLQGQFRASAHTMERITEALENKELKCDILTLRRHEKDYLLREENQYIDQVNHAIHDITNHVEQAILESIDKKKVQRSLQIYQQAFTSLVEHNHQISATTEAMRHDIHQIEPLIEETLADAEKLSRSAMQETQALIDQLSRLSLIVSCTALLMGIFFSILAIRSITKPLQQLSQAAMRIQNGDLQTRIIIPQTDEIGMMAHVIDHMVQSLQGMILIISQASKELEQEQDKLTTILLSAREGIVVTNRLDQVVLVNPAAEQILEKNKQTIMEEGFANLIDDPQYIQNFIERFGVNMPDIYAYKSRILNLYIARIINQEGKLLGSAALIRDITEEKKLEQQLIALSYTDGLTGLLNRRRLDEILEIEYARSTRHEYSLALILFDVDHFKRFNDEYGHAQGDRVLQFIGSAMQTNFRKTDYCCRYGGEEFCVIMPLTSLDGAVTSAEMFRQAIANLVIDGLSVTITLGVACYPLHGKGGGENLITAADEALYVGKKNGRNQITVASNSQP